MKDRPTAAGELVPLVRPAAVEDVLAIAELLARRAPETIPVPSHQIREALDDYVVIGAAGRVRAAAALHPIDGDRLELRSVAVDPDCGGAGLGTRLVRAMQHKARRRGKDLLCVTTSPAFFAHLGFERTSPDALPPKPEREHLPTPAEPVTMFWQPRTAGAAENGGSHDSLRRTA